jgi:quinol monooxygenase YgiN
MVLAKIRITTSAKKFGEALRILRSMAEQCSVQPGCLSSRVYRGEKKITSSCSSNSGVTKQNWSAISAQTTTGKCSWSWRWQ